MTTSGTFSPTLKVGIALALIDAGAGISDGALVTVDVRGRPLGVKWSNRPSSRSKLVSCEVYNRRYDERPLEFTVERNASPASGEVRDRILADPGFGRYPTDHMVSILYTHDLGWHRRRGVAVRAICSWTRRPSSCTTRRRSSRA